MATTYANKRTGFGRYLIYSRWTWISIAATLIIWLYALSIAHVISAIPPHVLADAVVLNIFRNAFAYDLFVNIGSAILISRIVAAFVGYEEHKVRDDFFEKYIDEQRTFYDERIREVAQSSFRGVYQSRFPDELINEVLEVGFSSKFIRENLTLDYKLRNAPKDIEAVIVEATAEYRVRNISTESAELKISIAVPNPIDKELKEHCGVIQYRKNYEIIDCKDAIKDFRFRMAQSDEPNIYADLDSVRLSPGEYCHVVLVYSMAKEVEDTELMRTGMPTMGLNVTIHDETEGDNLRIIATAVHRCPLRDISPPGDRRVKEYRSEHFFLPNQGFIWAWKQSPIVSPILRPEPTSGDGGE